MIYENVKIALSLSTTMLKSDVNLHKFFFFSKFKPTLNYYEVNEDEAGRMGAGLLTCDLMMAL